MIGQNRLENDFHWLFINVVYQQIENSERANQIHRFTIEHCKFILKLDRNTENVFYFLNTKSALWILVSQKRSMAYCPVLIVWSELSGLVVNFEEFK